MTRRLLRPALTALLLTAPAFTLSAHPASAQAVITGNQSMTATVESVDPEARSVLLRDKKGSLLTITIPKGAKDLPHLDAGDRISMRFFQTMAADIAKPDSPLPESTVSSAKGYAKRHPHGTLISFQRQRVRVIAVDAAAHKVTFVDHSDITRTVTITQKALFPLLSTLKMGDEVDVTTMDAVSFSVLNRTVNGAVSVTEDQGTQPASH
ncbi:preprotein translocase subunit YajC [Asaia sp. W19]|uniref:preprotein translocase subunit YajC n=1 Tax=unclassified Asaia TaxID=2685023 RepID=UPI000F8E62E3|nr:preprotein translocase subunit YajC [Asaia sp. W19]RUT27635.1 preprotein translocase subunit YajC [Asaia sp. W19]